MSEPSPPVDLERLVDDLRRRLEARRRAGLYPPALEAQMDEHARQFAAHRMPRPDPLPVLRAAVVDVGEKRNIHRVEVEPKGATQLAARLQAVVDRSVHRDLDPVIGQLWIFAAAVTEALERSIDVLEQPPHDYAAVLEQLDAALERISALEAGEARGGALGSILDRLERLEAAERDRQFDPFYSSVQFEAAFRGSPEDLKAGYSGLADRLVGHAPVVDIGCGQGSFLELLAERGVQAVGVELSDELVGICRSKGLDVEQRDGLQHLEEQQDASLGAVVLLQVIEHLSHQQVADLFLVAYQKLRPGGLLAIESVNPQSLFVYARAFYLDPTHSTPVHPAYVEFLAQEAGFSSGTLEYHSPVRAEEALTGETEDSRRINLLVFGPQDYLFLGVR